MFKHLFGSRGDRSLVESRERFPAGCLNWRILRIEEAFGTKGVRSESEVDETYADGHDL